MDTQQFVAFVRERGLGIVATRGPQNAPQSALVGVAATDAGEIVFDTDRGSRKFANLSRDARVSLVIGWNDEMTVQLEGTAEVLADDALRECQEYYFEQYPDGQDRAQSPDIALIRVTPSWGRLADFRPEGAGMTEIQIGPGR